MHGTWGVNLSAFDIPLWLMPIVAICVAVPVGLLARHEMNRIQAIKKCLDEALKDTIYNGAIPQNTALRREHQNMPLIILGSQILLAIIIICFVILGVDGCTEYCKNAVPM